MTDFNYYLLDYEYTVLNQATELLFRAVSPKMQEIRQLESLQGKRNAVILACNSEYKPLMEKQKLADIKTCKYRGI